jgi:hypothetical protein
METTLDRLRPIWKPHDGQREFLLAASPFKVLACGRRWGKSDASAVTVIDALLRVARQRVLLLAPTLAQARIVFERAHELYAALAEREGLPSPKVTQTPHPQIRAGPHRVVARSGHCGRFLRGTEADHLILDDAAFLPEELLTEVAMPMLATTGGTLTLLSTPCGKNHFWRFFSMGLRGEHGLWARHAPSHENPRVRPEFLALQRELISDRAFRVEYEAEFADSDSHVFSSESIGALFVPSLVGDGRGPVSIGIDWARSRDATAVVVLRGTRDGAVVERVEHLRGLGWRAQVERVAGLVNEFPGAEVLGDGTGVGDPVMEMLRELCPRHRLDQLLFTSTEKQRLVEDLAVMLDRGRLRSLAHPALQRELSHFSLLPSRSGAPRYGASNGYHDDLVIALALAVRVLPISGGAGLVWTGGRRPF